MTESIEDEAATDIVADIATLARKLAGKEPFKSASGPDALRAFATHLEAMAAGTGPGAAQIVNVPFRSRRKG